MTTQSESVQSAHQRAVRFFWGLLIGATTVSLIEARPGNTITYWNDFLPNDLERIISGWWLESARLWFPCNAAGEL